MKICGIDWPQTDEIIAKIKRNENLSSDDLLALQSRTFYIPIHLLDKNRGNGESDKGGVVRNLYNILRALDNGEDGKLSVEKRIWTVNTLRYIVSEVARRDEKEGIEDIVSGGMLKSVRANLIEGSRDEKERIFAEEFGKGVVLEEMKGFDSRTKELIDSSVGRMQTGMSTFLERGPIQTKEQLRDYCFYVAGSIGLFLNRILELKDGVILDDEKAKAFGHFLQVTNIIKGLRGDYNEGRVFLPTELHRGYSTQFLMDGKGVEAEDLRKKVLEEMIGFAKGAFDDSVKYVGSIPANISGYRSFSVIPFVAAVETLQTMGESGSEKVFSGDEGAIKADSKTMMNILQFGAGMPLINSGKDMSNWIAEYGLNPEKYSFKPGKFESWFK